MSVSEPGSPMFDLSGKVAVVTGGASGIGLATTRRLARAGAEVVIADLRPPQDELESVISFTVDVTNEQQVERALKTVVERFGHLDVLVNNAGVGTTEPLSHMTEDALDRNLSVNLKGVVWGIKHASRLMARGGSIVNMASLAASYSLGGYAAYSASKAAVVSLTRTAAIELADKLIRVNCICPNAVETPMLHEPGTEAERAILPVVTPLRRAALPEEIAAVVHFLAADDSSYITGEALFVDGGVQAGAAQGIVELASDS